MNNSNIKKNKKGFTLVETLVALFIFSISVMTVMSVLSQGISSTNYAKNKMVAGYLSQEGIEYVRNMRDSAFLLEADNNLAWNNFVTNLLGQCTESNNGCYILIYENQLLHQTPDTPLLGCSLGCKKFNYDPVTGMYVQTETFGAQTSFSRKMKVEKLNEYSIKIISEVTFASGLNTSTVSLSENLTNWAE